MMALYCTALAKQLSGLPKEHLDKVKNRVGRVAAKSKTWRADLAL